MPPAFGTGTVGPPPPVVTHHRHTHTRVGHRFLGAFAHERRLRPRDPPHSSQRPRHYRCRTRTCSSRHARKDPAIKRPERFSLSRTRAAAGWKDHREAAVAVDAVWTTRSPLSRVSATERRSREHDIDHTRDCQRTNKLPTMPLTSKLLQPPSAAKAAKPCGGAPISGCQLQRWPQGEF